MTERSDQSYDWRATAGVMADGGWVQTTDASYAAPEDAARITDPTYLASQQDRREHYLALLDEEAKRGTARA